MENGKTNGGIPEKGELITNPSYAPPLKNGIDPAEKDTLAQEKGAEAMQQEEQGPKDKFRIVYFILLLHGIGTLMPWNMFITANSYFVDYKLNPNPNVDPVTSSNFTLNGTATERGESADGATSQYRVYFLSFLGFTAQIPNLVLNAMNLFCQCGGGGNITKRIIWSIIIVVIMFIFTVVLAMVDSSGWPGVFFWITMISVVIINMANGVYQNSVYGMAACLPMKYTNAVVLGSNISGTLTAVLSIISTASSPNPRTSAVYYFMAAIFVLLVAFDTYFALPLIPFYKYHSSKVKKAAVANETANAAPPFSAIFKKCWVQDLSVWFTFVVTLTCFPAIQANIRMSDPNFIIPPKYFTGIGCFLFFNMFAMLGNLATEFVQKPGPRWVWLPVVLRGLFIPFFMFCNYQPSEGTRLLPVLITNDYVYLIGGIIMAFTSGYFSSLTMMYAPGCVEPQHQGTAGMMAAFFLIFGIFFGVTMSLPVTYFIQKVGPAPT